MRHLFEYYEFDQLSNSAKENAIDNVREEMYKGNWIGDMDWVIDDDSLFEPSEEEMTTLFGPDYYENNGNRHMIENTRKNISLVSKEDPNYYIHCADALDVSNDNLFLRWLGILYTYFESAEEKFKKHMDWVLTRISNSYSEQFEESGVIHAIQSNEIVFDEDGEIDGENY